MSFHGYDCSFCDQNSSVSLASLLGLLITVCNYFVVNSSFLYDYNVVFLAYFCH